MIEALRRFFGTLRARLSMPLFVKELAETSARRRTYILRVVYALALFLIFWITLPRRMFAYSDVRYALLGYGRQLFEQLMLIQVFGVALFLPALMCGRITQEKERDSLVLLFLTELRPWGIVLQKYLGGLAPMLSFLLLGLPLAGVAYAFGGLETRFLVEGVTGLLLLCLQVGALTLMCSAWCRTTVGALISSYILGTVFYAGPPLLGNLLLDFRRSMDQFASYSYERYQYRFLLIPQAAIEAVHRGSPSGFWPLLPVVISILLFLLLTRVFLVRRAFLPPLDFLPRLFARLDRLMKWANRFVGGVVLYRGGGGGPVDDPIFWRETQRRVLGKPHYLFRLLCALEIPTVAICMMVVFSGTYDWSGSGLSITAFILAALAMFTLSATAANSIVSERVGQTLEVLLTTPLTAVSIIRQKERALRRLEWILAVPLITVFLSRVLLTVPERHERHDGDGWSYFTCAMLMVIIYLPLVTWLSLWIGLRVRTRFQAILAALSALTGWVALTPLLVVTLGGRIYENRWWLIVSPAGFPSLNEFNDLPSLAGFASPWPAIIANAVVYTAIALFVRYLLFRDAERCLRR